MHIRISDELWSTMLPRKDIKNPVWFGFPNAWIESDDFFSFTGEEFKAIIYIMSSASKKASQTLLLQPERADRICKIDTAIFWSAVKKMIELGHLSEHVPNENDRTPYGSRTDGVRNETATGQDRTQQDKTGQDSTPLATFEVLKDLQFSPVVTSVLQTVDPFVQEFWLTEYPDLAWLRKVIGKAILKKRSEGKEPNNWGFVISYWLVTEKERPHIKKPTIEWQPPKGVSIDEAHDGLLKFLAENKQQSLLSFIGGSNAQSK